MATLKSIKLQRQINIKQPDLDLWCPVVRFGKSKKSEYRFPIVFNDYSDAKLLYEELNKLIGQPLDEVKKASEILFDKYKKYHYSVD